jgi:ribosomal protein L29
MDAAREFLQRAKALDPPLEKLRRGVPLEPHEFPAECAAALARSSANAASKPPVSSEVQQSINLKEVRVAPTTASKTRQAAAAVVTPANPAGPSDADWDEPSPVENICSNDVLEWELERLSKQIEQLKGKVPEELQDRRQNLQTQLTMLQVQVSTGQLDQDVGCRAV